MRKELMYNAGEREKYTMNTINNFTGMYRYLSNFAPSDKLPPTLEHWYQASKSVSAEGWMHIMSSPSPGIAKARGKDIKIIDNWDSVKEQIMLQLLRVKFSDPRLAALLVSTGHAELVEGNHWHDNIWGSCRCSRCGDGGKNLLGVLLMRVRTELSSKQQNISRIWNPQEK